MKYISWSILALALVLLAVSLARGDELRDFGRDIRPILSDKCFACHGPDEAQRTGGFRLDQKESALGETDSGARPIVPGDPQASEVFQRITTDDADLRMPPADSHKVLTPDEIERIRQWIAAGAPWKAHWSFVAPVRPAVPPVKRSTWPLNEIDNFILARLEAEGLDPSPAAEKTILLRRVTLDLTGLPPTPDEVQAFLLDNSADAYEKVVDRLLASPRYGEHMARHWLDAARYGDTHGLHLDNYREMWPYRDWAVAAFNRNLPYDQFTIEQLAGDLLDQPTEEQLVATGFNRCHVTTNEGGSIVDEVEVRNVVDRVVTMGTVFMGLTFDCTRCHDHKYDPFTMKDFYSLYAYFNSLDGSPMDDNRKDPAPVLKYATPEQKSQLAALAEEIGQLEAKLDGPMPEVDAAQATWEEAQRREVTAASSGELPASSAVAVNNPPQATPKNQLTVSDWYWVGPFGNDRRYLRSRRHGPEGKQVDLAQKFELATGEKVGWVRKSEWVDGSVHTDLPGELVANFLYRTIRAERAETIKVSLGSDDAIRVYVNDHVVHDNDVDRAVAPDQDVVELKLKPGLNHLLIKIINYQGGAGFYFKITSPQVIVPAEVYDIARRPANEAPPEDRRRLREFYRYNIAESDELKSLHDKMAQKREASLAVDREIATTLIWREKKEPVRARILTRGEYDKPAEEVARRTPASLPMAPRLPNNRLGLAQWMLDPAHPLTARVAVNRFWQQVFGCGIVKTSEDFGSQGEPPTHPELLDWLAVDFRESGWDVKQLMKRLVMSASYRQTSRVTPELWQRDPANRLLARGPRFRLDAEMLRDQALIVSGLLVEKLGGPSVKPPQPAGLWEAVGFVGSNTEHFVADEGPNKVHRRALYTFIKRTSPPPQMTTFDAPSREYCITRRERTNTPLQALVLMNEPQFIEAARALAERTLREANADSAERARYMFRLCVGRAPTFTEVRDLLSGVAEDYAHYQTDRQAAKDLIAIDVAPPEPLDPIELAAWTMAANTLLSLDEVVTKN
ncbi:MAG: PSD1 and planctomycete cytochrome C domain-containing protein [Pirellulales bacterium]